MFRTLNIIYFFLIINHFKNNEIMAITKVWIEDGCTGCGLSEAICPDVFKMDGEAMVIDGVDFSKFEKDIIEAAESCPVEVIKYS